MKEFVFEVIEVKEEMLTAQLMESGFISFYFEKSENKNFLKIYLDNDELPSILINEIPVSSSDIDPSSWSRVWGENYKGDELTEDILFFLLVYTPPDKKYKNDY
jgi:hypothetical protein